MNDEHLALLAQLIDGLNAAEAARHAANGYTFAHSVWHIGTIGRRFVHINCGTSGAFLLDAESLELYNIKGYGVPDHNKKKKADIGNLLTVDPAVLFTKRYNYLR